MGIKSSSVLTILVLLLPIAESKEVFNVYVEHLPPNVVVSKGSVTGRSIDIINEISEITGFEFNIRQVPWARAYHDGLNNPNIMFTGLNRINDREKKFIWLYKLGFEQQFVWALKGKTEYDYKSGRYVFAQADHKLDQFKSFAQKQGFTPTIYTVTTREQAIKMLYAGRGDFIVGSERYLKERSQQLALDFLSLTQVKTITVKNKGLYIALSKETDPKTIRILEDSINNLAASGRLNAINQAWLNL